MSKDALQYPRTILDTVSTLHGDFGIWIPVNSRTKKDVFIRRRHRRCSWCSQDRYFPSWTCQLDTAVARVTATTATSALCCNERQIWNIIKEFRRGLLDVLALFDCHQSTVDEKNFKGYRSIFFQRMQINLLPIVKRYHRVQLDEVLPISEDFLNLICELGDDITRKN